MASTNITVVVVVVVVVIVVVVVAAASINSQPANLFMQISTVVVVVSVETWRLEPLEKGYPSKH